MKKQIKERASVAPLLPGTLEKRYNTCGNPECHCNDKVNPRKHGPYYRLSYNIKGKNSSVFVPDEDAAAIMAMTDNYRKARANAQYLALELVELYRKGGLQGMLNKYNKLIEQVSATSPESKAMQETRISRDKCKRKAPEKKEALEKPPKSTPNYTFSTPAP